MKRERKVVFFICIIVEEPHVLFHRSDVVPNLYETVSDPYNLLFGSTLLNCKHDSRQTITQNLFYLSLISFFLLTFPVFIFARL